MNAITYRFILHPLRQTYRKIFRPKTRGVKVIIIYKDEILLIKNSYGVNLWNLPGGGVKRNEAFSLAAKREIKEEVGIKLTDLKKLGSFQNTREYIKDTVTVFKSRVENKNIKINKHEIKEASWFSIHKLPSSTEQAYPLIEAIKLTKYH